MKVIAKNLEILLLQHDLVMVPGLGGFVIDYKQAEFDDKEDSILLPPGRSIMFNKDLKANDGLMVNAYMQNYDATYPQALRQLEIDVEQLLDQLNEEGWVCLDNVGTLRKDMEGHLSFEQIHATAITPSLFALPSIRIKSLNQLENELDISQNILQASMLTVAEQNKKNGNVSLRWRRWRDIGVSSAAAIAMFFMFAFPYLKNNHPADKIIAGAIVSQNNDLNNKTATPQPDESTKTINNRVPDNSTQPQIILLQAPSTGQNAIVISQQDINNSPNVSSPYGKYSIVITVAANEQCAQSVIDKLEEQNIPGAFHYKNNKSNFVLYSRFETLQDAQKALKALRPVNKRFAKAWIMEIK